MTLQEIKDALDEGKQVFWANTNYEVIKDVIKRNGQDDIIQYLIHSHCNDHYIGLTHVDGVTMNGKEDEFFISERMDHSFLN